MKVSLRADTRVHILMKGEHHNIKYACINESGHNHIKNACVDES